MRRESIVFASLATLPAIHAAYAEVYLTEEQAVGVLFPGEKLAPSSLELSDAEAKQIEDASGERVRDRKLKVWRGPQGKLVFIDRVVGKHEFITYAVAVETPAGGRPSVKQIEILEYRETYGSEVRRPEWRKQFVGKTKEATLKVGKDIQNISGATLSSVHVTAGVRRILQTCEALHARS